MKEFTERIPMASRIKGRQKNRAWKIGRNWGVLEGWFAETIGKGMHSILVGHPHGQPLVSVSSRCINTSVTGQQASRDTGNNHCMETFWASSFQFSPQKSC